MKTLKEHIYEALKIGSKTNLKGKHNYHPKTKNELESLVYKLIKKRGKNADLNDIDVSKIDDMSWLFHTSFFNGNISQWDVSNVANMAGMFYGSEFNGDISKWDVSNVEDMNSMFDRSKFDRDISGWDVDKVEDRHASMFYYCPLDDHPEKQPKFNK